MTFMSTLDSSIVNVALPVINRDLNINMGLAELVVSVYLVTMCDFLLLFGKLGDIRGKRRLFKFGVIIFTLGSLFCGISHTIIFLLISRFIQAIGSALAMSSNFGIITEVFPNDERGQALGWIGSFVALGMIAGPSLGGLLLSRFDWDSIFLINVPIGIVVGGVLFFILKKDNLRTESSFNDYLGAILFIISITGIFGYIYAGQQVGFGQVYLLMILAVAIIVLFLFIKKENKINDPLLDLVLFKNKGFTLGITSSIIVFVTNSFYMVFTPFYLQNARGLSASFTGLLMTILPIIQMIGAPLSGKLADRFGSWKIAVWGLIITAIIQLGLGLIQLNSPIWLYAIYISILGLGSAIFQAPNNSMIMGSVKESQLGVAGSLNNFAKSFGIILGNAVGTSVLFIVMSIRAGKQINNFTGQYKALYISGQQLTYGLGVILLMISIIFYFKEKRNLAD